MKDRRDKKLKKKRKKRNESNNRKDGNLALPYGNVHNSVDLLYTG